MICVLGVFEIGERVVKMVVFEKFRNLKVCFDYLALVGVCGLQMLRGYVL